MLSKRFNFSRDIRVFQTLGGFKKSRKAVTLIVLFAWIIAMPVAPVRAGDILRGGASAANGRRASDARANAGAAAADTAKVRAQDRLARTTKVISDMRALQASARAAVGATSVPNGLVDGGLKVLTGPNAKWEGANAPVVNGNTVNIRQKQSQALLHWETFNVGKDTTLNFDQSAGGMDAGKWIAFNKVFDPAAKPSEIRGKINAQGQVYIINQNGILFGAGSQVNARALVASTLPINDNLVKNGLLNNKDAQFLFSALEVPGGSDGTPTFIPSDVPATLGDIIVERGAKISSPELAGGNGGRVMLVGANVRNEGEISTPAGQTILAAGLQVGVQAHNSSDPSLRGLDAWVGSVGDYAGTVTNTGLIESKTGSILAVGRHIAQSGILESMTSVNLNGRIDLLASYGAVANPNFDNFGKIGEGAPMYLNQFTGDVVFSLGSLTRILPDYESIKSVPGIKLSQSSQINVDANEIHFATGSMMLAPSANVRLRAGVWPYKDDESNNHTIFNADGVEEDGLSSNFAEGGQRFFFENGVVQFSSGSILDVAGTPDAFVPIGQHIMDIQLRGTELADSPLQRTQKLRGKTLTVDLRRSGVYGGRFWIGTPLGDATGLANIIERNAAQLTTRGGTVAITSGGSVNVATGSEINVSGGYTFNEGGFINTSRLIRNGNLIDISAATPDVIYDGIFDDTTSSTSSKWGITKTYNKVLSPLARYKEPSYIEGAAGGSLKMTAPSVILAGNVLGNTITGPKQLNTPPGHSSLSLSFKNQKRADDLVSFFNTSVNPPAVVFSSGAAVAGLNLPNSDLGTISLSNSLCAENGAGFGFLNIENMEGTILIPKNSPITLPVGGSLTLKAANVSILSPVQIPGGALSVTAYNYSPFLYEEKLASGFFTDTSAPPAIVEGQGIIRVGSGAVLDVGGTIADERPTSLFASDSRRALDGGTVLLEGFSLLMDEQSAINASGGATISSRGKYSFGRGGSIKLLSGKDPNPLLKSAPVGGLISLPDVLNGYSATNGGSLTIQAMNFQIGSGLTQTQFGKVALAPEFFQSGGFSDYSLLGIASLDSSIPTIEVLSGSIIHPWSETLIARPFGNRDGSFVLQPRLLAEGVRSPASLTLRASGYDDKSTDKVEAIGSIVLGEGALIKTDPRGNVSLKGQTLSIFGSIESPAGKISIEGGSKFPTAASELGASALTTVHLGPSARLFAQGSTVFTPDPYGRRTGQVLAGGTISLKGNIVAESGAVIDVSGTSDELDFHPSKLVPNLIPSSGSGLVSIPWARQAIRLKVDSNGGAIQLQGSQMLFSDAELRGFAGGPTAIGGLLSISSGAFLMESSADINLVVTQMGFVIPPTNGSIGTGKPILDAEGAPFSGRGYFTADRFSSGGFDSLDLGFEASKTFSSGNIQFVGPVTINAPGAMRVASGGIIKSDDNVVLNAGYISIGQPFLQPINPSDDIPAPFTDSNGNPLGVAPISGLGKLQIGAQLVDVGNLVLLNMGELSITASNGDIRGSGSLNVAGKINLTAGQIYPTTLAKFDIFAYGDDGSVQISQSGNRALPMSAGGSLSIYASSITNAGTLRAPFGSITLGWDGLDLKPETEAIDSPGNLVAGSDNFPVTQEVILRARSVTSVSGIDPRTGQGIVIPFGLSPDGNSWIDPRGVNVTTAGLPEKKISLAANSITQETNSIIDLRGGGDLFAFRWISGPGGSADILGTPTAFSATGGFAAADLVSFNGKTYSARMGLDPVDFNGAVPTPGKTAYWLEIPDSYAILPGLGSEFAPFNPFNTGGNAGSLAGDAGYVSSLKLGDKIVLGEGGALPAGAYTLLPRRYGVMPGAYLVTPVGGGHSSLITAEGATFSSGYRANSFSTTSAAPAMRSNFEVLSPAVLAGRAEYETYTANTFIPKAAADLRSIVSQALPRDSAALAIQGNNALTLQGNVLTQSAAGIGAAIDISSQAAMTIGSSSTEADGVILDASRLNSWGASSLLIGGLRRSTSTGTVVDVNTDSITLDGSLAGPDIILASKNTLTLKSGSSLSSTGSSPVESEKISIAGQGAFVRVSSDAGAEFNRMSTNGANEPSLVVEDGVSLSGAGVILESTSKASISSAASLSAQSLFLGSARILVDFDGSSTDSDALILSGGLLSHISTLQKLSLNSYSSIDFNAAGTLGSESLQSLDLNAGGLRGMNSDVTIQAANVLLANSLSSIVGSAAHGSTLQIMSRNLELGYGSFNLAGFHTTSLTASSGVRATESGSLTTDGALTISTPAVAASRLTNYEIMASSDLVLNDSGGTSNVSSDLGASLSLTGSSVTVNSDIYLPSGLLKIKATSGDVSIGSQLSVEGTAHTYYDTTRFADAGTIVLQSDAGHVILSQEAKISASGATHGGRAGLIEVSAPTGEFRNEGLLFGAATSGYEGGSFHMDIHSLADFAAINNPLESGGFTNERIFRVRTGDVAIDQAVKTKTFELAADGGSVIVSSEIDASGEMGGRISISASGSLNIADGAALSVAAKHFNSAGKGGEIYLAAGSQLNGVVDAGASLNLASGALDLSVEAFQPGNYDEVGSSAFNGQYQGILHLRAPRTDTNLQVAAIGSTITGASAIIVEGFKLYDLTDSGGVMNIALRNQVDADATAFMSNEGTIKSALFPTTIPNNLVLAPGVEIINRTGDLTLGLANPTGTTDVEGLSAADWDLSQMRYGAKNAPGILTLRAAGDIVFNNSLSDGFKSITPTDDPYIESNGISFDANGHSRLWLAQLQEINPDLPVNVQSWSYTVTAGSDLGASNSKATLSEDLLVNKFGDGAQKGSIFVGEFYPAKPNPIDTELSSYSEQYAFLDPNPSGVGGLGTTAANLRINLTEKIVIEPTYDGAGEELTPRYEYLQDMGTRYEVIRTGTGDISLNAPRDVQLRNQFSTIYTAGIALPDATQVFQPNDFVIPVVDFDSSTHPDQDGLGLPQQVHTPQWTMAGGNLKILAGKDIARTTRYTDLDGNESIISDSSHQITSNWLYRRGHVDAATGKFGAINYENVSDTSASTTWWVDYSNFFQGVGALGGGDISLLAGKDIINVDAVAPTNARMAGVDPASGENQAPSVDRLRELGGGDLLVKAGRNIDGGLYYIERGQGRLDAGSQIKTNSSRSPSFGLLGDSGKSDGFLQSRDPEVLLESNWLPTTLFLGKGHYEISAKKDVLLGPVVNAFLMPAGLGNRFWYKTYFNTYSSDSGIDVSSLAGELKFKSSTILPAESASKNVLSAWMENQNIFKDSSQFLEFPYLTSASLQPWSRLTETGLEAFSSVVNLAPPIFNATSFSGQINFAGNIILSPSPKGNLQLIASGSINGLQPVGTTELETISTDGESMFTYSQNWIASSINVSDGSPELIPNVLEPFSYYHFNGESGNLNQTASGFLSNLDSGLAESGSYVGSDAAIDVKLRRHGSSLLHEGDENPVKIYASKGSLSGLKLFAPKFTYILAGENISDVSFYIQNIKNTDVSIVAAGGDAIFYNENSTLRGLASNIGLGNILTESPLSGDIQISGPGILEVIAGRNLDLGSGPNLIDGTGIGISSIGNARNPNLPFAGASLIALAGLTGKEGGAALGLADSTLAFEGLTNLATSSKPIIPISVSPEHKAIASFQTLFALIQQTGQDYPDTGSYEPGLAAVEQAFAKSTNAGDILTRTRNFRTISGGEITLAVPNGGLTMASDIPSGSTLTPPGIVTEYGGAVSILTSGDVDIGRCRIFTLRGGDMTIWSTSGDIAAGTSPKTVVTAPPTRVLVDTPSADVKTDLGGLATGGGIGVLAAVENVEPGNVYLLAPEGTVDAGDAGIQSTGNLNIAAVSVVNADNISTGGSSSGVPSAAPAAAAPVAVSPSSSSSTAASSSAAQNMATQGQSKKELEEAPSLITVEVLGYGGGEGDKKDEEEVEKRDEDKSAML